MRTFLFTLGIIAVVGFGVAGGQALAQTRRLPVGEWADMGEANGVRVYRFGDGNRTCYVTTPGGGITCL